MKRYGRIIAFFLIVIILGGLIGTTSTSVAKNVNLGLDLQGGFEILYEVEPINEDQKVTTTMLNAVVQSLYKRVDVLGVNEPNIEIEGNNRIRVQLAGVHDQQQAREILSTTARLEFRGVNDEFYFDGSELVEGSAKQDFHPQNNTPIVFLKLKSTFENSEFENFNEVARTIYAMEDPRLVIWLDFEEGDSFYEESLKTDHKYISAPVIENPGLSNDVIIQGNFTVEEAKQLADILNAGSLPANLEEVYSISVGAQFGEQALDQTIFAGAVGIALIFIYMIIVYRFPGMIATITLSVYIYLVLIVFEALNGVLTLPGIAALVLGVGMAVDANIITYERLKEEIKAGKTVMSAFKAGNKRAFTTILDANLTTIIAAVALFIFGTSSVKGFATMLIISILMSFITNVYLSRFLLGLWVKSKLLNNKPRLFAVNPKDIKDIAKGEEVETKFFGMYFDIVKRRRLFFILTGLLVLIGAGFLGTKGLNLGIDFVSGSRVQVIADHPLTQDELREEFEQLGYEPEQIVLAGDQNEQGMVRFNTVLDQNSVATLNQHFEELYGHQPSVSTVTPQVGRELALNAVYAVLLASVGILIYIAFRFEFLSAVAAIIGLLHDAFIVLALFSIFQFEFDITIIAAILTIVGYSINDTIVTFDRIRENLQMEKRVKSFKHLAKIVNDSLIQTLGRSFNTAITVIFAALMLFLYGAQAITYFSFGLIVGLLAGTYSSLFLAAQMWLVWRGKNIEKNPIDYRVKKKVSGPQV